MKVFVLTARSEDYGYKVVGAYSDEETAKAALREYLGKYHSDGFEEFWDDDESEFDPNPWTTPTNADNLAGVLEEMHYENDAGEWATIDETEICGKVSQAI